MHDDRAAESLGFCTLHGRGGGALFGHTISSSKPPLSSSEKLSTPLRMPPRILRFRLRLDRFQFSIGHPGKELYTADALSRAPTRKSDDSE